MNPMHLWDKASRNLTDFTTYFSFTINSQGSTTYGDGLTFFLAPPGSRLLINPRKGGSLALTNQPLNSTGNQFVQLSSISFRIRNETQNVSINNAIVYQSLSYIVDLRDYLPDQKLQCIMEILSANNMLDVRSSNARTVLRALDLDYIETTSLLEFDSVQSVQNHIDLHDNLVGQAPSALRGTQFYAPNYEFEDDITVEETIYPGLEIVMHPLALEPGPMDEPSTVTGNSKRHYFSEENSNDGPYEEKKPRHILWLDFFSNSDLIKDGAWDPSQINRMFEPEVGHRIQAIHIAKSDFKDQKV
ncbi:hypothetical protein RJ639_002148 [Escallonia herrerae]|uniref:Legume lectin domain-containing protein n=1 Tax=Escallonia herrerae TaxID=1293975 RepID=A0AA88XBZ9_9ASTE|nr:hypothetical protein RJ639_002148 [Escallonia herrerae]